MPADVRERWRAKARGARPGELYAELAVRDPETAEQLRPTDTQRLVRALEVLEASGQGLAHWHRQPGRRVIDVDQAMALVLAPERDELYCRADRRFEAMLEQGALEEVRKLRERGLSGELPVMRALGVAHLLAHLAGEVDLAAAAEQAKLETRHYIKRQMTWLRSNMMSWNWIETQ